MSFYLFVNSVTFVFCFFLLRWATISSRQKRWNNSVEFSAFYLFVCRCHNLIIDWFIVCVCICVCIRPLYGYRLIANRITGPGLLSFIVDEDVRVHVHATNEIPSTVEADIAAEVFYGTRKEIIFKIVEMVNDQNVENVPIEYRKCRFTWERVTADVASIYEYYGHSTCTVECLMQFQRKFCNCTQHPLTQQNETPCDVNGFICLTKNFGKFFHFSFIERNKWIWSIWSLHRPTSRLTCGFIFNFYFCDFYSRIFTTDGHTMYTNGRNENRKNRFVAKELRLFVIVRRARLHDNIFIAGRVWNGIYLESIVCHLIRLNIIHFDSLLGFSRNFRDEAGSLITIKMLDLPKLRYERRNVKTVLDYVSECCVVQWQYWIPAIRIDVWRWTWTKGNATHQITFNANIELCHSGCTETATALPILSARWSN